MSLSVSHAPAEWREVFAGAQARGSVFNLLDWLIVLRRLRVGAFAIPWRRLRNIYVRFSKRSSSYLDI